LFEALTDYRTAAGLDHPRANQELLLTILGIAHLRRIIFEVAQVGEHGLFAGGGGGQFFAGLAQESGDVARCQPIPPGFRSLRLLTPENLRKGG